MARGGGGQPIVVYIGGSGRSGSTLLECMLSELPDVVVLGEVTHLWERGLVNDELCACAQPFHDCPFWREVGTAAFGGWDNIDAERILELKGRVDRQRRLLSTYRRRPSRGIQAPLAEYTAYYAKLYAAARAVTGAQVVVDSSKVAPTATALSHAPAVDLRVLHIVRDSRGVAYSWQKAVERPEKAGERMPQPSVLVSTEWWLVHNGCIAGLHRRGVPVSRLRYEDLVTAPATVIAKAWRELALPGTGDLPMVSHNTIHLTGTHSVAGNPMRFRTGLTTLRPDTAWVEGLRPVDRSLVTALSWPMLRAFGYQLRTAV